VKGTSHEAPYYAAPSMLMTGTEKYQDGEVSHNNVSNNQEISVYNTGAGIAPLYSSELCAG
jgi:hypothetical protein